jgi:signal peptidase I
MAPNDDMSPRISAGDVLLYYRIDKAPNAQDVIVLNKNGTDYVGRVVAAPGDTVDITKEDALIVNGNMVVEDNIFYKTPYYEGFLEYPLTLGEGEYFVLADKREGGEDSRYYGPVQKGDIKGTVIGQFRRTGI